MRSVDFFRKEFVAHLENKVTTKEPTNLYEPITYILSLGGKRLRPVLTLLATDLFEGDFRLSLDAALAIEVFHNFSLIHDDIMDDAPLRRGHKTVHEKWDTNTGILSGDAMLILSYQLLENYDGDTLKALFQLFNKTSLEVCEGQQYDIDFETRTNVTIDEYLKMIAYKTAVLVASAMKMGAIIAQTTKENQELIYEFGLNLGVAFQLQDDYLDAFGDPKTFGKQLGGDIIENKKTFLYLKSLELGNSTMKSELLNLYSLQPAKPDVKIAAVKAIFEETGAVAETKSQIEKYTHNAFKALDRLQVSEEGKNALRVFGESLMQRKV
ncbi:MAG: polyprenyl synthetase family protein [Croceitalea sp.]|nr:polyprenyl synthetase family protein [Croceitalea sp.]